MGVWEVLTGIVTAVSSTITALTMQTGNSLVMRSFENVDPAFLAQVWSKHQTADTVRIRGPQFHDNVQGIRLDPVASEVYPLLPWGTKEIFKSGQTLVAEAAGSATAGDIEIVSLLVYYSKLPGIEGTYRKWDDIKDKIKHLLTVENTLALGTSGDYTGEEALNAEFDLLKSDHKYALLGYLCSAECGTIRYRGIATGNLGTGGPGMDLNKDVTRDWFKKLSMEYDVPAIPVFNADDKAAILLDGVQDEDGADVTVTSIFAELED